jgi:hypothetical protein
MPDQRDASFSRSGSISISQNLSMKMHHALMVHFHAHCQNDRDFHGFSLGLNQLGPSIPNKQEYAKLSMVQFHAPDNPPSDKNQQVYSSPLP